MSATLSIVTVTYNDPVGLKNTLQSLLEAAELILECIVVDSSPEKNNSVLAEFQGKLRIVHIVTMPSGIYAAMNDGAEKVRGDQTWFLNGGDRLHGYSALRAGLDFFSHSEADALCMTARLLRNGVYCYSMAPVKTFWMGVRTGNGICHQAVIYRTSSLKKLLPFNTKLKLAADYELHLRAWKKEMRLLAFDQELVDYDVSGASSKTEEAIAEFRIAVSMHAKGLNGLRLQVGLLLETARIRSMKQLGDSALGPMLKQVWLAYKRREIR